MCFKPIVFIIFLIKCVQSAKFTLSGNIANAYPCLEHKRFVISLEISERPQDQENKYYLYIHHHKFAAWSTIAFEFNSPANVTLSNFKYVSPYSGSGKNLSFHFFKEKIGGIDFTVQGADDTLIPYLTSVKIQNQEKCLETNVGVFDDLLKDPQVLALTFTPNATTGPTCGRRQLLHTELITNSVQSKPGDWPWHVAIYRLDKATYDYKCGGTLLSNVFVLTAAHCVMSKGVNRIFPINRMKIYLGKYNLYEVDEGVVVREVKNIIVHDRFNISTINHDIALIKMKEEVEFGPHIQPVCLWNPRLFKPHQDVYGTVVGWGYDTSDRLTPQLRQATMPIIDGYTCISSNPVFFGKYLDQYKFCAGYKNGTSACNGDSGGGFVVFVPDRLSNKKKLQGSWFIRGIVSIGVSRVDISICQPNEYVLFTDVSKYKGWIEEKIGQNITDFDDFYDSNFETDIKEDPKNNKENYKCGQRKGLHGNMMTYDEITKPGDWPWHVAIYYRNLSASGAPQLELRCSGALLSRKAVLTNSLCTIGVDRKVMPADDFVVFLGKYYLDPYAEEVAAQRFDVEQIIEYKSEGINPHDFDPVLLGLKSEAIYNDYVQPICVSTSSVKKDDNVTGIITGWGFNDKTTQAKTSMLHHAKVSDVKLCSPLRGLDEVYHTCADIYANGTPKCNNKMGDPLAIWVPTRKKGSSSNSEGAWYLRGLFDKSLSSSCNSIQNSSFLNIEKMNGWIMYNVYKIKTGERYFKIEDNHQVWGQP